jgi:hypothetical protein
MIFIGFFITPRLSTIKVEISAKILLHCPKSHAVCKALRNIVRPSCYAGWDQMVSKRQGGVRVLNVD